MIYFEIIDVALLIFGFLFLFLKIRQVERKSQEWRSRFDRYLCEHDERIRRLEDRIKKDNVTIIETKDYEVK